MTQPTHADETPATLLAPLARGLLRRAPEILSLSINDAAGHALWSSSDFLLPEDYALIAEVIEEPHDVRGFGCGLWWESADTARARCALALFEGDVFRGVVLAVFSGLTTGENERAERVAELDPVLPVLARAIGQIATVGDAAVVGAVAEGAPAEMVPVDEAQAAAALASEYIVVEEAARVVPQQLASDTTVIAQLRFVNASPDDSLVADLKTLEREQRLMQLIDTALREDEFALHLQPIVSLREDDSSVHGSPLIVEVLIRLPTEEFGVLASHDFLDTAERNGRMPAIDRWVIRALLVWMQRNRERWADAKAVFSVNLSGKSVVRPDFRDYLEHCLDKSGLPLNALRFEVAELDASIAPQEFTALARSLIERGCEVSVDNAGTGSGRFEFLREVNADILKIDGSLVNGAHDDIVSRALINGLVHMADTLGMRTVASQVDSTGKLRAVKQLGVDFAQGYQMRGPEHIDSFNFLPCGAQRAPEPSACA